MMTTPGHAAGKAGAAELCHGGSDRCLALRTSSGHLPRNGGAGGARFSWPLFGLVYRENDDNYG